MEANRQTVYCTRSETIASGSVKTKQDHTGLIWTGLSTVT